MKDDSSRRQPKLEVSNAGLPQAIPATGLCRSEKPQALITFLPARPIDINYMPAGNASAAVFPGLDGEQSRFGMGKEP